MKRILLALLCIALLTPCVAMANAYAINHASELDVVSITIDPDALWNKESGLFAEGDSIDKSMFPFANSTYFKQIGSAREAELAYYPAGTDAPVLQEQVTISLLDNPYAHDLPQKSLTVLAADGAFDYAVFPGNDTAIFCGFELSNGDGDGVFTRVAAEVQTRLIESCFGSALPVTAIKPVVVYINGEYWGHYNLKQLADALTICQAEGIPADQAQDITIIRPSKRVVHGDGEIYLAMISQLAQSSPNTNTDDRAYLDANIDAESYLNWFAATMYFGDASPAGARYYQVPGGQWKCMAQPGEYGLFQSTYNSPQSYTDPKGMTAADLDNTVFLKLLEVDEYRALFLTKLGSLYQAMTTEVMQSTLDACVAQIEAEMPAHFERWAALNEPAILAEAPTDPEAALEYWRARITRMRDGTMVRRPYYVYTYTQEVFSLTDAEMQTYFGGPMPEAPAE